MPGARRGGRVRYGTGPAYRGCYPGTWAAMRYQELLDAVRRAGVPEPVEVTVSAVLTTLGEELPAGTAGYLAANLPAAVGARMRRRRRGDDEGAHMDRSRLL